MGITEREVRRSISDGYNCLMNFYCGKEIKEISQDE